tara:strand:+ start:120 stop:533 length:414 start_codon:yes stop_codon:yes gene_type:complete
MKNKKHSQSKNKDIANDEVRPDVWFEVSKMVDPVKGRRSEGPPSPGAPLTNLKAEEKKSATEAKPVEHLERDHEDDDDDLEAAPKPPALPEDMEKELKKDDETKEKFEKKLEDDEKAGKKLEPAFVYYDEKNTIWRF